MVQRVSEAQSAMGHEVHVITAAKEGAPKYSSQSDGVIVHRLKSVELVNPDFVLPLAKIESAVLRGTDIVHVHSYVSAFNYFVSARAKTQGAKIVTCFMGVDSLRTHTSPVLRSVGLIYQQFLFQRMVRLTDKPIVKSHGDLSLLSTKYRITPSYIPDGVDAEVASLQVDSQKFRRQFGLTAGHLVLYLGRLHRAKGPQILVQAIPFIKTRIFDFKVVFMGPGDSAWLKRLAVDLGVSEYVVFTGVVNDLAKISALDSCDCLVIPSLYDYVEGYSIVTSEAFARRKPVIASSVGELRYRIVDGRDGYLIPPGSPQALAAALTRLLTGDETRLSLSHVIPTWLDVAKMLCQVYDSDAKKSSIPI